MNFRENVIGACDLGSARKNYELLLCHGRVDIEFWWSGTFQYRNRLSLIPYRVQDEHQDNLVLNGCASDNTAMGYQRLYLETLAFENLR